VAGNDVNIIGLQPENIAELWPLLKPAFDSFAERASDGTTHGYLADCLNKKRQCWIVYDGAVKAVALTEVSTGEKAVVDLTHCYGQGREDWQEELVSEVMDWGKSIGAVHFRAICRPGWTKFLKGMGMRETHRVMERAIDQE